MTCGSLCSLIVPPARQLAEERVCARELVAECLQLGSYADIWEWTLFRRCVSREESYSISDRSCICGRTALSHV